MSSVKDSRKRKVAQLVEMLKADDWLIVPEIFQLGRSILAELKKKGVNFTAIKGSWSPNGRIESKVFLSMMRLFSEIMRNIISARTKEALRARKVQAAKLGRPKGLGKSKLDEYRPETIGLLKNGSIKSFVAES